MSSVNSVQVGEPRMQQANTSRAPEGGDFAGLLESAAGTQRPAREQRDRDSGEQPAAPASRAKARADALARSGGDAPVQNGETAAKSGTAEVPGEDGATESSEPAGSEAKTAVGDGVPAPEQQNVQAADGGDAGADAAQDGISAEAEAVPAGRSPQVAEAEPDAAVQETADSDDAAQADVSAADVTQPAQQPANAQQPAGTGAQAAAAGDVATSIIATPADGDGDAAPAQPSPVSNTAIPDADSEMPAGFAQSTPGHSRPTPNAAEQAPAQSSQTASAAAEQAKPQFQAATDGEPAPQRPQDGQALEPKPAEVKPQTADTAKPASQPADPAAPKVQPAALPEPVRALAASFNVAGSHLNGLHLAAANDRAPLPLNNAVLAVEIVSRFKDGMRRFDIRLDPPELGRIDVRLEVDRSGNVSTRLTVDRAETLDLMQRDARGLERALQQAGLKTDGGGLEFSLRSHADQPQADGNRGRGWRESADAEADDGERIEAAIGNYRSAALARGGVDIRI